jgi:hypothetical protein
LAAKYGMRDGQLVSGGNIELLVGGKILVTLGLGMMRGLRGGFVIV